MHSLDGIVSENERAAQAERERAAGEQWGNFFARVQALRCEALSLEREANEMSFDEHLTDDAYSLQAVRGLMLSAYASADRALRILEEE